MNSDRVTMVEKNAATFISMVDSIIMESIRVHDHDKARLGNPSLSYSVLQTDEIRRDKD